MNRHLIVLSLGFSIILFISLFAISYGTLEVTIERTPTLDQASIATLASLMLQGTQYAQRATDIASRITTEPTLATVQGKICYPSEQIPEITAYFRKVNSQELFEFTISENQDSYTVELPSGKYYAWAWAALDQIGGLYSKYVVCGMTETCTDHSPLLFEVQAGTTITGIDICDWALPLPTEQILPS